MSVSVAAGELREAWQSLWILQAESLQAVYAVLFRQTTSMQQLKLLIKQRLEQQNGKIKRVYRSNVGLTTGKVSQASLF